MPNLSRVDGEILAALSRADGMALPPKAIAHNSTVAYSSVQVRLPLLDERGLTRRLDEPRGYRRITERGREALKKRRSEKLTLEAL